MIYNNFSVTGGHMARQIVVEPHQIIDSTHTLSIQEIRIIQLVLASVYRQRDDIEYIDYVVPLKLYSETFELSVDGTYDAVKDVVAHIMTKTMTLKTKLVDVTAKESSRVIIHWVDRVIYDPIDSTVSIRFHPDLVPLYNNLGKENLYSSYHLENTRLMKSINSIRLFRVLNKWKLAGKYKVSVKELRDLLGIEREMYGNVTDFRSKVIERAMKEINAKSELTVKLEQCKLGKTVTDFIFTIGLKKKGTWEEREVAREKVEEVNAVLAKKKEEARRLCE
jgi:plasmid replication initiation protein